MLYGEARKKPLQSATSAPAGVAGRKASTSGPPAPAAPPLRVRPTTADVDNSTVPRVGRSEFHSVTDAQPVKPRGRAGTVSEQDEQLASPFAQSGIPRSQTGTASEQDEKAAGPFAAVSQALPPPGAQSTSPLDVASRGPQQLGGQPAERPGGVPSLAEAQRRMAIAPTPFMPPQSMMKSNPRTSMTWRSPEHVSLQIPEESDINALADQMP